MHLSNRTIILYLPQTNNKANFKFTKDMETKQPVNTFEEWFSEFKENGSQKAFTHLYDFFIDPLYNYGMKIVSDAELVKDCIHDVFVKLYVKKDEVNIMSSLKSYLYISTKNRIVDELRRQTHLSDLIVEEIDKASSVDIEEDFTRKETENTGRKNLACLLNQLPPRQKLAITLYYLEEKKYEDMCKIMHMNYQSVRNLIHRAMTNLKALSLN